MNKQQRPVVIAILALVGNLVGCSAGVGTTAAGAGGFLGSGGSAFSTTAGAATGGASSSSVPSGGTLGSGGLGTGGVQQNTGGAEASTGGATATGGRTASSPATGGKQGVGGTTGVTGGAPGTGGSSAATGGREGTGGSSTTTGGASGIGGAGGTGGAGTAGSTSVDPNASAAINACIDKLPYGGRDLSAAARAPIITAIINTCAQFAPPGAEWQKYCQMFLVGAINAESSFNTQAGAQGAGTDPSVGLLQIRFSATVRDFVDYGPIDAMARIGCDFGTVSSSDSYATKRDMMLDVNCNIALATWYIFTFGSGNGGPNVVWVYQYCAGGGVAGNLHIGMASYLMGADAAHSSLSGADFYYNEIKGWFDPCVTYSGTHPFELPIEPDVGKYCG